jgi:endonuclease YncB( thermonuclease family)
MKRTIVVAVVAGFIALFNGWIATNISPAFRLPETIAEDVADKVDTLVSSHEVDKKVVVSSSGLVTGVIDGDTIEVSLNYGETALVRYIGIDTPERGTDKSAEECFYNEATNKNKELVEGKEVTLVRDVSDTDKYGRLLRYVYVGEDFINERLISEGYATVVKIEPDTSKYPELEAAELQARESKLGMWSACY